MARARCIFVRLPRASDVNMRATQIDFQHTVALKKHGKRTYFSHLPVTQLPALLSTEELLCQATAYDAIVVVYSYNFTDPGNNLIRKLALLNKPLLLANGGRLHLGGAPGCATVPGAVVPQLLTAMPFLELESEVGQQRSAALGVHQAAPTARLTAAAAAALPMLVTGALPRTGDAAPLAAARRAAALAALGKPQHLASIALLAQALQPLVDALASASLLPRWLAVFDAFDDTPAPAMDPLPSRLLGCARVSTTAQAQRFQVTVVANATAMVMAARGMDGNNASVALARPASALLLRREQSFRELSLHDAQRDPATADFIGGGEVVDLAAVGDTCIITTLRNFGCLDFAAQLESVTSSGDTELLALDLLAALGTLPLSVVTASGAANIGDPIVSSLLRFFMELVVINARIFLGQHRNLGRVPALNRLHSVFEARHLAARTHAAAVAGVPGGARTVVLRLIDRAGEAGVLGVAAVEAMRRLGGELFSEDKPPALFALSMMRYVPGGSAGGAATAAEWAAANAHATAAGKRLVDAALLNPLINVLAAFFGNMDFAIRFMASLMRAIYFTTVTIGPYLFGAAYGGGIMHLVSYGVMQEAHVGTLNGVPVYCVRRPNEQPRLQAAAFVEPYHVPGVLPFPDVPAVGPSAPAAVAYQATAQPGPYPRTWAAIYALVFVPADTLRPPPPLPTEEEAAAAADAEEAAAAEAAEEREVRAEAAAGDQDTTCEE